jgi:hypothetical protein
VSQACPLHRTVLMAPAIPVLQGGYSQSSVRRSPPHTHRSRIRICVIPSHHAFCVLRYFLFEELLGLPLGTRDTNDALGRSLRLVELKKIPNTVSKGALMLKASATGAAGFAKAGTRLTINVRSSSKYMKALWFGWSSWAMWVWSLTPFVCEYVPIHYGQHEWLLRSARNIHEKRTSRTSSRRWVCLRRDMTQSSP